MTAATIRARGVVVRHHRAPTPVNEDEAPPGKGRPVENLAHRDEEMSEMPTNRTRPRPIVVGPHPGGDGRIALGPIPAWMIDQLPAEHLRLALRVSTYADKKTRWATVGPSQLARDLGYGTEPGDEGGARVVRRMLAELRGWQILPAVGTTRHGFTIYACSWLPGCQVVHNPDLTGPGELSTARTPEVRPPDLAGPPPGPGGSAIEEIFKEISKDASRSPDSSPRARPAEPTDPFPVETAARAEIPSEEVAPTEEIPAPMVAAAEDGAPPLPAPRSIRTAGPTPELDLRPVPPPAKIRRRRPPVDDAEAQRARRIAAAKGRIARGALAVASGACYTGPPRRLDEAAAR